MTRESGLKPSKPMSIRHPSRQECIDAIPRHAYRLGIDGDGRTHYHAGPAPRTAWVVEDGEVIHRQGLGSEPIVRGSTTSPTTTVGKSANRWNSRRVRRSSRRLSRAQLVTCTVLARKRTREAAIDCARVPIVTSADVLPPTPERDHWMLEVVVEAVAVPATVLDALANAELSVRDISPQGQTRVVEAVA